MKTPADSQVTTTHIVLPTHTNALGTIFGGTVMAWIDIAAAISAIRHAGGSVVTASIDALHFLEPIKKGQIVTVTSQVNAVSKTSMEVGIQVEAEDYTDSKRRLCVIAFTTFVAVDSNGKPKPVPPLKLVTPKDIETHKEAEQRREYRLRAKSEIAKILQDYNK